MLLRVSPPGEQLHGARNPPIALSRSALERLLEAPALSVPHGQPPSARRRWWCCRWWCCGGECAANESAREPQRLSTLPAIVHDARRCAARPRRLASAEWPPGGPGAVTGRTRHHENRPSSPQAEG